MNELGDVVAGERAPVVIVGGGLTGLSAALFLSWQGVRPLLVERHPDLLIHPRARGFTPRTIELYRQVGLEEAISQASYAQNDAFEWVAVAAETLAGEHHPVSEPPVDAEVAALSPAPFGAIDQDKLELVIRPRAAALGADIRFSTELIDFTEDETGVTVVLRDRRGGEERTVRTDYLVAADGWESPIRQRLGIAVDGPGPFFQVVTLLADADLTPVLRGRKVNIAYLQQPRPGTMLMAHDEAGLRWVFGTGLAAEHGESLADFTDERAAEMLRVAAGLADVAVSFRPQIPGTDLKALSFAIGAQLARHYRAGRVFLAGDAAHIVPPTGGLGANTGIQDAHNLAWKLAAVLRGEAAPALLDTYEAERRPVGQLTMEQALARWGARVGEGVSGEAPPMLDYATVAYGYRYQSAAVIGAAAEARPALPPRELMAQPGTRAPHVWLERDGARISTVDLFGRGFVLLTGSEGQAWVDAAGAVSGLDIDAYGIGAGGDLCDVEGRFTAAYGLAPDGAVLVRPDGFVAWRAEEPADDPAQALATALSALLGKEAA